MPKRTDYYLAADPPACRDCGTSDGLGWWRSRTGYGNSGSSHSRCHPCYKAYCRARYYRHKGQLEPVKVTAATRVISCANCGVSTATRGQKARFCSTSCANQRLSAALRISVCGGCGMEFRRRTGTQTPNKFCSRTCMWAAKRSAKRRSLAQVRMSSPLRFGTCAHCSGLMVARMGRKYCSDQCRIDRVNVRVTALYRTACESGQVKVAMHWRNELVAYLVRRDGPKCGLCGKKVDLTLKSGTRGSDLGSSVDHVIPRSKGGSDELSNLRLTHWGCNRKRGNRGVGEQLRLVG